MISAQEARKISEENTKESYLIELIDNVIRRKAERGLRYVKLILKESPDTRELIQIHAKMRALGFASRSRAVGEHFQFEIFW